MVSINDVLHDDAIGLRLCRIDRKGDLHLYEAVVFERKRAAVELMLRRAAIAGHVVVDPTGDLPDTFADVVINDEGDWVQCVALDKGSFRYLRDKLRPRRDR